MRLSTFDMFKVGLGPSSSHTMGPMVAAQAFLNHLDEAKLEFSQIRVKLYGSLALTGVGHRTDIAIALGLVGYEPHTVPIAAIAEVEAAARSDRGSPIGIKAQSKTGSSPRFVMARDLDFAVSETHPAHSNALTFTAIAATGQKVRSKTYLSIGGGFVLDADDDGSELKEGAPEMPFSCGDDLLQLCSDQGVAVADIVLQAECSTRSQQDIEQRLDAIRNEMMDCVNRGLSVDGVLPGGLNTQRRAKRVWETAQQSADSNRLSKDMLGSQFLSAYAIAVNEENAAGHRVVTAPTNGACGTLPAVLKYLRDHVPETTEETERRFLLSAAAIGMLCKRNASISGAEVGCQGEVGVASAMAAAGFVEACGGSPHQVENAAEIALEHHLGMTCDPIGGLVQIPCIERNAMGAVKAVNAALLSLGSDGRHTVSLDKVIATMAATGRDMSSKYKETSLGGLAVNVVEC